MKIKNSLSKQILSLVLALVMVLSMLPVTGLTAFAADTDADKAITLGTSGIADGDKANNKWDYVYYGTYNNNPIKWRVLSKNGNGGTYTDNEGNSVTAPIFLLSEYVLKNIQFENSQQNDGDGQSNPNDWQKSSAQAWCRNDFAASSFSDAEKKYVLKTTKTDAAETLFRTSWGTSELKDDTAFFISAKEASDYLGSNAYDEGLIASADWWLRSPYSTYYAGYVSTSGFVNRSHVSSNTTGARPAFNLNPSSVLFTSAAEGGKPEDFSEVAAYSGSEWKLTLKDDSRSGFVVDDVLKTSDGKIHISYSGATTGNDEYISAIIESADGNVTHYGRLKNVAEAADASGTVELDLSSVTINATDTLYIFNEQYNGDYKTDYASELKAVTIPSEINAYYVTFEANGGTDAMNSVVVKSGETYTLPANGFTASSGYQFKGWATTKDGPVITDTKITVTADTTLYAIWEMIPAEAPTVTAGSKLTLTYNGYTNQQISVSVNEQTDYTYSYQWYDGDGQLINGATDSTYTVPNDLAAGSYSYYCRVTAKRIDNELTNYTDSAEITVTVNKATPGVTAPTAKENLEYNGSEQELISAGSATNGTMQYALGTAEAVTGEWKTDIPKATKAGTYYVWYKVVGNENYNDVDPVCITVTVAKVKITVTADDKSKTYGSADPALTWGITSGALAPNDSLTGISLSRATGEDADQYTITVSQTAGSNPNYNITLVNGTFTIAQKAINVSWSNTEFTYDGTAQKPTATTADFVANDDAALTVSGEQTNAGVDYTATVTITGTKAGNYKFADGAATTTKFTIKKADQDKPAAIVSSNETISGKQDGYFTGVDTTMEYRKDGETDYNPITGDKVENLAAGKYFVRVMGKENYNPSPDTEITIAAGRKLAVTVPQNQIGYTLTVDKNALDWQGQVTITFALADGYSKSKTDFAVRVDGTAITLDENDKYIVTGAETDLTITVAGVVDETAPEAEISITTNKWTEFLKDITFGLFFKETQDVTITATDKGSGVDKIYYYISEDVLTEDEVEVLAADKWTLYDADNKPSIDPDKKCVVYVKATDKAQNVKFISSTGLVFDGTAPALFGIENGGIYYGDKIFKATDDNFLKIEVDGIDVTDTTEGDDEYKIVADNAEHTVTVTDKAGNKTEYKITVYKNYTVTYKVDGETYSTQTVGYGKDAMPPAIPEKEGYTQTAPTWDKDGKNITADTVINAVYTINSYTITLDHPTYDSEILVNHGMSFNEMYPDIDANVNLAAEKDYHTFIGWYESTDGGETLKDTPYDFNTKVFGDITLYPMFKIYTYTVTYKVDDKVVGTVTVEHGADATAPAIPEKEGHTQTAPVWDKDGKNITADTEINTVYTINEYTVTFMSEDDVYKTVTVKHGEKVTMPEAPTKDGYTVKWEKVLDTVTRDTTVKAVYTEIPATDKPSSPQTGDTTNLWLWIAILFISGGAMITLTVYDRKRRTVNSK